MTQYILHWNKKNEYKARKNIFYCVSQVKAVVDLLYSYAVNCDNLSVLENEESELVGLSVNMNMEAYQYPLIAASIVEALR